VGRLNLAIVMTAAAACAVPAPVEAQVGDWRTYHRFDHNRPPSGGTYFADDYYRDGRYYRERRLVAADRVYRGRDGRYYCRRHDGTTALIIGSGIGRLIGGSINNGRSALLGTIISGTSGPAPDLRCR
jgi:hypothetical protein